MSRPFGFNKSRLSLTPTTMLAVSLVALAVLVSTPDLTLAKSNREKSDEAHDSKRGEDFQSSWRLPPGKTIQIKGVNGSIPAEPSGSSETEVTAVKRAHRSDPDEVRIEVIEDEDGITVCAVYPAPWGKKNSCEAGDEYHSHVDNNDVQVEFTVRVGHGVCFVGKTVNGGIEARDLEAPVRVRTVNGSVRVSTDNIAEATTVNGSIVASVGSASWKDDLEFSTVNGSITVDFPAKLNAHLSDKTMNGEISTDFPLTVIGRFSKHRINGQLGEGDGGGELSLSTVNGSIRLRSNSQ